MTCRGLSRASNRQYEKMDDAVGWQEKEKQVGWNSVMDDVPLFWKHGGELIIQYIYPALEVDVFVDLHSPR